MARILMVVHRLLPGGTETHVHTLATALKRQGHAVGVLTSGGSWVARFRAAGIRVHLHPAFGYSTAQGAQALSQVVSKYGYQVVHLHDTSSLRLLFYGKPPWCRVVATIHGTYVRAGLLRSVASRMDAVIAVSPVVRHYLITRVGISDAKVSLIPNSISTTQFRPTHTRPFRRHYGISDSAFVIGYAGRFTLGKRHVSEHVYRTLRHYARQHRSVYVLIAGRGSREVLGVHPSSHVYVCGVVSDMAAFYNSCDVVIGTGRVAIEAAACGVPTIGVGVAKYAGVVTDEPLKRSFLSNFGDHGKVIRWHAHDLLHGVRHVRHHLASSRLHAMKSREEVKAYFSAISTSSKVQRVYRI